MPSLLVLGRSHCTIYSGYFPVDGTDQRFRQNNIQTICSRQLEKGYTAWDAYGGIPYTVILACPAKIAHTESPPRSRHHNKGLPIVQQVTRNKTLKIKRKMTTAVFHHLRKKPYQEPTGAVVFAKSIMTQKHNFAT